MKNFYNSGLILEGLYDIGFRKGDFISIWIYSIYISLIKGEKNEKFLNKRKDLLDGNLIITFMSVKGVKALIIQVVRKYMR